jgi:hypothetical protein
MRKRVVKEPPIGDIQITIWIFFLTRDRYTEKIFILLGGSPFVMHSDLQADVISSSSLSWYKFVISPEFNILFNYY